MENRNLKEITIAFVLIIILSFTFYQIGYLAAEKENIEYTKSKLKRMKIIYNKQ